MGASRLAGVSRHWSEPTLRHLTRLVPLDVLWYINSKEGKFSLTFDDGPHQDVTPQLLDVLARHQAKATFFLIGQRVIGNESIVRRIAFEGHELANHLMRDDPSILLPDPEFRRQLRQVTSLLAPYGQVRWFRPGSGWVTRRMVRSAAEMNLRCALGTVVARHTGGASDERIARRLVGQIRRGTIAVLHEGSPDRLGVAATADSVLAELGHRGLTSVTLSELVEVRRSAGST